MIFSGIVAITLSPIMSAYMAPMGGTRGPLTPASSAICSTASPTSIACCLTGVLRLRAQVLAFGAFICVLAVPLYMFSGKELAPVEDQGFVFLLVNSAPDASLAYTASHMDKVYKTGTELPEFEDMFDIVFASNGFGGYLLKNWHDRDAQRP